MRSQLAATVLRAARWTAVGEVPRTGVLVGAPHTSNWDFVMMLLVMWRGGVSPRVLMKRELFRGPLAWLLPRLGGIPLDRDDPGPERPPGPHAVAGVGADVEADVTGPEEGAVEPHHPPVLARDPVIGDQRAGDPVGAAEHVGTLPSGGRGSRW